MVTRKTNVNGLVAAASALEIIHTRSAIKTQP